MKPWDELSRNEKAWRVIAAQAVSIVVVAAFVFAASFVVVLPSANEPMPASAWYTYLFLLVVGVGIGVIAALLIAPWGAAKQARALVVEAGFPARKRFAGSLLFEPDPQNPYARWPSAIRLTIVFRFLPWLLGMWSIWWFMGVSSPAAYIGAAIAGSLLLTFEVVAEKRTLAQVMVRKGVEVSPA